MDSHYSNRSGHQRLNETKAPEKNKSNEKQELWNPSASYQTGQSDSNGAVPLSTTSLHKSPGNISGLQIKYQPELHKHSSLPSSLSSQKEPTYVMSQDSPSPPPPPPPPPEVKYQSELHQHSSLPLSLSSSLLSQKQPTSVMPQDSPPSSSPSSSAAVAAVLSSPQEAIVSQESSSSPATTASPCQDYETIKEDMSRTGEITRNSDPHTACHGHDQGKEEQRKEQEERNTGNQVPGSPTGDQESSLIDQLNDDSTSVEALKDQIRELKTESHKNSEEREKMKNVVVQLMQEKQQHYSEVEEKNKIIRDMQHEKAEMEEDVECLRQNLDREMAERQDESTKNNSMISSLKKKLNETTEEKSSLQQELLRVTDELNVEKEAKEKQLMINKQLHDQVEELKQNLTKKEMLMKTMEDSMSALRHENEDIKSSFEKSQSEVNDFHEKLNAVQEQYMTTLNQLLVMSVEASNAHMVVQTLEKGADTEFLIDCCGSHPLHLAAAKGHAEVVWHLLQKGAKATSVDSYGNQPIHIASREGHQHVVDKLLRWDKKLAYTTNIQGWNAAQYAADMGHVEVLKTLYKQAPEVITHHYQHQETLLTHTVVNNHLEASEWLLAKGVRYHWSKTCFFLEFSHSCHLILAWCLTLAKKYHMAVPVYMALGLLRTARWWLNNKDEAQQKEKDSHLSFMTSHGLPNLGNTCYMNSVLQCLYHSQPFTDQLLGGSTVSQPRNRINLINNEKGQVATAYLALCAALKTGTGINKAAKNLKQVAGKLDSTFQGREQQEAHDFLCSLLQWLHEDLTEQSCSIDQGIVDKSAVSDLFHGTQLSTITCCITKEEINRTEESFSNLSLPVTKQGENKLQEVLAQHFMEQNLMWECDICGKEHKCVQKTSILIPPKLLIIHLSRYTESQPHHRKLKVTFPEHDLRVDCCQEKAKEYQLYALCDHIGSMSCGHYTAWCRTSWKDDASHWMYFSDNIVHETSLKKALSHDTAHILFYRSVN